MHFFLNGIPNRPNPLIKNDELYDQVIKHKRNEMKNTYSDFRNLLLERSEISICTLHIANRIRRSKESSLMVERFSFFYKLHF